MSQNKHIRNSSLAQSVKSRNVTRKSSTIMIIQPQQQSRQVIEATKLQLDNMILTMDEKIKKRIQVSHCSFVAAYKNHVQNITKQLNNLKQQNQKQYTKSATNHETVNLRKQCILFRQQSLKLHDKIEQLCVQLDIYKRKNDIISSQLTKTDQKLKRALSLNMNLKIQKKQLIQIIKAKDEIIQVMNKKLQKYNKQDLGLKIIEETNKNKNIKSYNKSDLKLQIPSTNRTSNLRNTDIHLYNDKLQQVKAQENKSNNFKIFDSNQIAKNLKILTVRDWRTNQGNRTKTHSNFEIQNDQSFNYLHSNLDTNRTKQKKMKTQQWCQEQQPLGLSNQIRDQLSCFKNLIYYLNKCRAQTNAEDIINGINSKNMREFIFNDQDILNFTVSIFPTLSIHCSLTPFGTKFKAEAKINTKTVAHLSSQIMRKLKLKSENANQTQNQKDKLESKILLKQTHINSTRKTNSQYKTTENEKLKETNKQKKFRNFNYLFQAKSRNTINKSTLTTFPTKSNLGLEINMSK